MSDSTLASAVGIAIGLQVLTGQPLRFAALVVRVLAAAALWLEYAVRDALRGAGARWRRCWIEVKVTHG